MSVFPLTTVLFWADQRSVYRAFTLPHIAAYVGIFRLFTVSCVKSEKPQCGPFFLLVPAAIEPILGLVTTLTYNPTTALELFVYDLESSVLPLVASCATALMLARYIKTRKG